MQSLTAVFFPRLRFAAYFSSPRRCKTTSAQYVAARFFDPTFEKLMDSYKHLVKVFSIRDLILASPSSSLPLPLLSSAAQRLRLNRGAAAFVYKYPHIFSLSYDPISHHPVVRLTPTAEAISRRESAACCPSAATARLRRLLSISISRSLPLRAIFRLWREFALPDDFEYSVIAANPSLFSLQSNPNERNTHILHLVGSPYSGEAAVDVWRNDKKKTTVDDDEVANKYRFEQLFPPGMRLSKDFKKKVKDWQRLPYAAPYREFKKVSSSSGRRAAVAEKRAVAVMHEVLSLTAEGMAEVEQVSHFRKWFNMELNVRDLFLDHPGIFYMSTKGKRHTVFLREMYEKGRLIKPNEVYEARRSLLDLVMLRKRGFMNAGKGGDTSEDKDDDDDDDDDEEEKVTKCNTVSDG